MTSRDHLTIHFDKDGVWKTISRFSQLDEDDARREFQLGRDARDWTVQKAQADVREAGLKKEPVQRVQYRPLDIRYTYRTGRARGFLGWPVEDIWRAFDRPNVALVVSRMTKGENFAHALVSDKMVEKICLSSKTSNNAFVSPLLTESSIRIGKTVLYQVKFHEHKAGRVPLLRTGIIKYPHTDVRPCVNLFHPAIPHFMKTIKSIIELDISTCLHVFPRIFQYVNRCPGVGERKCSNGSFTDGTECGSCKGKGYLIHSSSQDAIILPLPSRAEDMFDLTKLAHYMQLPIDTVKWLDEFTTTQSEKAIRAVYSGDNFIQYILLIQRNRIHHGLPQAQFGAEIMRDHGDIEAGCIRDAT